MARIRTVKPEFWTSEQVVECSTNARLLFIGMWNFCDDNGIHPASCKRLKMEVYPADAFSEDQIKCWVAELLNAGLVNAFQADDGKEYWHVTGWRHQKIDKPQGRYPIPVGVVDRSHNGRRTVDDGSHLEGKGRECKGEERNEGGSPKVYAFEGKIIRLTMADLDKWASNYPSIRDLKAELAAIDAWCVKKDISRDDWFHRVSRMLNKKHQENLSNMPQRKPRTANVC